MRFRSHALCRRSRRHAVYERRFTILLKMSQTNALNYGMTLKNELMRRENEDELGKIEDRDGHTGCCYHSHRSVVAHGRQWQNRTRVSRGVLQQVCPHRAARWHIDSTG